MNRSPALISLACMLVGATVALTPAAGWAHALRLSRGDWSMEPGRVTAALTFLRSELLQLAPDAVGEGAAATAALQRVASATEIRVEERPCVLEESALRLVDEDGIRIELRWQCPSPGPRWTVRLPFLSELSAGHTHLARVTAGGQSVERAARGSLSTFDVEASPSILHEVGRFFRLGVEHIFTGYDHLAFLLGLLLLGGTVSRLAGIVSSFTLAHSVTLAAAALGLVSLPSSIVEPAIAASVVAVAAENLWALRRGADSPARVAAAIGRRWRLTFAFGLVHGFGFAGALRELELPRAALAAGLVSFNLGVEAGQLLLVLIAVPLLRRLGNASGSPQPNAPALSWSIVGLGLLWFGQRVAGLG